mmetsp:Transcript_19746/g.50078  ORF Transcript_19746/g.50078 Transcript_19746/m.50078 type:complete len:206 (-) Transcript_19746:2006-2623(-)
MNYSRPASRYFCDCCDFHGACCVHPPEQGVAGDIFLIGCGRDGDRTSHLPTIHISVIEHHVSWCVHRNRNVHNRNTDTCSDLAVWVRSVNKQMCRAGWHRRAVGKNVPHDSTRAAVLRNEGEVVKLRLRPFPPIHPVVVHPGFICGAADHHLPCQLPTIFVRVNKAHRHRWVHGDSYIPHRDTHRSAHLSVAIQSEHQDVAGPRG